MTERDGGRAVEVGLASGPPTFRFGDPFLFASRERFSGTILFIGVIGDPS